MINIKTPKEIEIMRGGGKIAARILKILADSVKPGIKTIDLDMIANEQIKNNSVRASFLGHAGYPASICTSVNSQVVHGIPGTQILKEGDIIGIDIGIFHQGFHTDTAITVGVGKIKYESMELIKIAKKSLEEAISIIKPGIFLGDIQHRIRNGTGD
ncbi:MAG: methionine aminopeptidase [Candidatus Berkelbacteria bacterium]|nr:methionine aminopeptidase [Candidatus Berkelbacteria bacterium]